MTSRYRLLRKRGVCSFLGDTLTFAVILEVFGVYADVLLRLRPL